MKKETKIIYKLHSRTELFVFISYKMYINMKKKSHVNGQVNE